MLILKGCERLPSGYWIKCKKEQDQEQEKVKTESMWGFCDELKEKIASFWMGMKIKMTKMNLM